RQRRLERTLLPDRLTSPIPFQQLLGSSSEHSADFPPLALHPWNHHPIVAGRLVTHPGDDRSFGSLLDRDAFRPGDCAASDWCGVVRDCTGEPVGEIGVILVKG